MPSSPSDVPPALRPGLPDHAIHPLIAGRWSSRAVDADRSVPDAVLQRLLEAARWAPSCRNFQPWLFAVATRADPQLLTRAQGSLMKGNAWAKRAPALIFPVSRRSFPGTIIPNRLHSFETGMATAQMALQAAEEGLVFHQMLGFSARSVRKTFRVPSGYAVTSAIAVGYPAPAEVVPEPQRGMETAERTRKPLSEIAFFNRRLDT